MKKTHKCGCDDPGYCIIEKSSTRVICGVKGIVDYFNVKIIDKKVICVSCESTIYAKK
jgi:hypothetical protein